jgi:hypothetical protein
LIQIETTISNQFGGSTNLALISNLVWSYPRFRFLLSRFVFKDLLVNIQWKTKRADPDNRPEQDEERERESGERT